MFSNSIWSRWWRTDRGIIQLRGYHYSYTDEVTIEFPTVQRSDNNTLHFLLHQNVFQFSFNHCTWCPKIRLHNWWIQFVCPSDYNLFKQFHFHFYRAVTERVSKQQHGRRWREQQVRMFPLILMWWAWATYLNATTTTSSSDKWRLKEKKSKGGEG